MSNDTYSIELCRGAREGECPHALSGAGGMAELLEAVICASGWPEHLAARLPAKVMRHRRFSVALAACANGCSRPVIADFGLYRAWRPELDEAACAGCGTCETACPDAAISMHDGRPVIDREACLNCGACIRACPESALVARAQGYRIQIGGRLGRHPRLGQELPGLYEQDRALDILGRCLKKLMAGNHRRLGDVLDAEGLDWLDLRDDA